MRKLWQPLDFYLWWLVYLIILLFGKWNFAWNLDEIFFVMGSIVGTHLISGIEQLFDANILFFRSFITYVMLHVFAIFVLTSSSSFFGKGVMLFLTLSYLHYLYKQIYNNKIGSGQLSVMSINLDITVWKKLFWALSCTSIIYTWLFITI